jgi:hypothetical protein
VARNITREELKAKMDRGERFVLVEALSQDTTRAAICQAR